MQNKECKQIVMLFIFRINSIKKKVRNALIVYFLPFSKAPLDTAVNDILFLISFNGRIL